MKNKWRFFAVTLAVVLCMTVFSVTAYAGGGDMDEPPIPCSRRMRRSACRAVS